MEGYCFGDGSGVHIVFTGVQIYVSENVVVMLFLCVYLLPSVGKFVCSTRLELSPSLGRESERNNLH